MGFQCLPTVCVRHISVDTVGTGKLQIRLFVPIGYNRTMSTMSLWTLGTKSCFGYVIISRSGCRNIFLWQWGDGGQSERATTLFSGRQLKKLSHLKSASSQMPTLKTYFSPSYSVDRYEFRLQIFHLVFSYDVIVRITSIKTKKRK